MIDYIELDNSVIGTLGILRKKFKKVFHGSHKCCSNAGDLTALL